MVSPESIQEEASRLLERLRPQLEQAVEMTRSVRHLDGTDPGRRDLEAGIPKLNLVDLWKQMGPTLWAWPPFWTRFGALTAFAKDPRGDKAPSDHLRALKEMGIRDEDAKEIVAAGSGQNRAKKADSARREILAFSAAVVSRPGGWKPHPDYGAYWAEWSAQKPGAREAWKERKAKETGLEIASVTRYVEKGRLLLEGKAGRRGRKRRNTTPR